MQPQRRGTNQAAVEAVLDAAVAAGVALPSETLDRRGLTPVDFDWRALNAFQAREAIPISQDEEGHPLPAADIHPTHTPLLEAEDEELQLAEQEPDLKRKGYRP